jgi:hypothetical protein
LGGKGLWLAFEDNNLTAIYEPIHRKCESLDVSVVWLRFFFAVKKGASHS